jgi:hypothetical protein
MGRCPKEIAAALEISEPTVIYHINNIRRHIAKSKASKALPPRDAIRELFLKIPLSVCDSSTAWDLMQYLSRENNRSTRQRTSATNREPCQRTRSSRRRRLLRKMENETRE